MNEINQENCPQQDDFLNEIDSFWKGNAEIIGIRKGLLEQTTPLFGYFPQFLTAFLNLKCPGMEYGAEKLVYLIAVPIQNRIEPA